MSIKRRLTFSLLAIAIAPALIVGLASTLVVSDTLRDSSHDTLRVEVQSQRATLSNYFSERMGSAIAFARMDEMRFMLIEANGGAAHEDLFWETHEHTFGQLYTNLVEADPSLRLIAAVDRNGVVVDSTNASLVGTTFAVDVDMLAVGPGGAAVTGLNSTLPGESSDEAGEGWFYVVAPVYADGSYQGFVVEVMDLSFFTDIQSGDRLFDSGYFMLIDSAGNMVAASCTCEFEDAVCVEDAPCLGDGWDPTQIETTKSGFFEFDFEDEPMLAYFERVDEAGWTVVASVEKSELSARVQLVMGLVGICILGAVAIMLIVARVASRSIYDPLERLTYTIRSISDGDLSVRSNIRDDSEIGEISESFDALMDALQQQTDRLMRSEDRYRLIVEETEDVIFEWDVESDTLEFSPMWRQKYGYARTMTSASRNLFGFEGVDPETYGQFTDIVNAIFMEYRSITGEYRLQNVDDEYVWVRLRSATIFDEAGNPVKAVGVIRDISEEKAKVESLERRAKIDELSQLLNRSAFEEAVVTRIERVKQRGGRRALLFIDVDDFKAFNDEFGHAFGDRVIRFIGDTLRLKVDDRGFAGRLGGDEFAVWVKINGDLDDVDGFAQEIIDELAYGLDVREDDARRPVGCSIGIALFPDDGDTYDELIQRADEALYGVKAEGKGKYRATLG